LDIDEDLVAFVAGIVALRLLRAYWYSYGSESLLLESLKRCEIVL